MELFQELTNTAQDMAGKISPIFSWTSEKIGGLIDVSSSNIHTILLILVALWLSSKLTRERGIKLIVLSIIIFLIFRWLQL